MAFCLLIPAFCQISQDHPELCGDKNRTVPVPADVSVLARYDTLPVVTLGASGSARRIELPDSYFDEIQEVCPSPDSKLVVFGASEGSYRIHIIDQSRAGVVDSFWAYDSLMSPDHRWIASRDFYPPRGEVPTSEEYLLYDLTVDGKANRHTSARGADVGWAVGWAMYPALPGGAPVDLGDIPESKRHEWRSKSFFWGPDSRSVVFAGSVGKNLSLVVVLVTSDKPQAYTHVVSTVEICDGAESDESYFTLENASVTSDSGAGPGVVASFNDSSGSACRPRQLNLNFDDFKPARVEVYEHRKLKPAVPKRKDQ